MAKTLFVFILIILSYDSIFCESSSTESISLTIEDAIQIGLEKNLSLASQKYDVDIARAKVLQAGLWRNPSISLLQSLVPFSGNYNQTSTGGPKQLDLLVNIPLDLSGKIRTYKNYTESLKKLQELVFYNSRYELVYNIFSTYTQILYLEKLKSLYKNREENLARLIKMIQNRIGGEGLQPLLLTRAQLALNNAKIETRMVSLNLVNTKRSLALLLGYPKSPDFTMLSDFRKMDWKDNPDYESSEALMKEHYPAYLTAKVNVEVADRFIEHNYAQIWNDTTLYLGVSRQSPVDANPNAFNSSGLPGQNSWAIGFNQPLPLFDRNQGDILAAKISKEQAYADLNNFEITIQKDLQQTLDTIHLHFTLIDEMEKVQLARAETVLTTQQKMFGTGGTNLLEYFDAINAYVSTLTLYYQSVAEYKKNWARYYFLVGKEF